MYKEVFDALEQWKFPSFRVGKTRQAISGGAKQIPTCNFGMTKKLFNANKNWQLSTVASQNPKLYQLLQQFGHWLNPNFRFSNITVNKNFQSHPHFDAMNKHLTMIVGFGNYQGGELVIETEHGEQEIDIKEKPFYFYGSKVKHWTKPFTGTRYSCVFYNHHHNLVLRPGTTDQKCADELFKKHEYTKFFTQRQGEKWCDIGANIGCFTARCQMNDCKVVSYEPDSDNYAQLLQNTMTPDTCHNLAVVADHRKHTDLYLAKNSAWNHTTLRPVKGRASVQVNCIKFEEAIKGCDCVKMDIEGAELPILDNCDFSGLKKMVVAYHVNYAPDRMELERRIKRLQGYFKKVEHKRLPSAKAMAEKRVFPNEVMIYCSNK